jgi:hypothetical protein
MPIGSHILKNPNDENEILERLPKEVRDALSTLQLSSVHWSILHMPKRQALRVTNKAIAATIAEQPNIRSLTAPVPPQTCNDRCISCLAVPERFLEFCVLLAFSF